MACSECKAYDRENIHEGFCNKKLIPVMADDNCKMFIKGVGC